MYIVLPNEIDGLDALISNIDCSDIRATQLMKTQIKVSLPKFKILQTTKLNGILESVSGFYIEKISKNLFNLIIYCYPFNLAWNS